MEKLDSFIHAYGKKLEKEKKISALLVSILGSSADRNKVEELKKKIIELSPKRFDVLKGRTFKNGEDLYEVMVITESQCTQYESLIKKLNAFKKEIEEKYDEKNDTHKAFNLASFSGTQFYELIKKKFITSCEN